VIIDRDIVLSDHVVGIFLNIAPG